MTATNRWAETGVLRKNNLLRAKLTLTSISASSETDAAVGDYYEFNCKTKTAPTCRQAPTWSDVTDNPSEPTGYAYAGKPDRLDTIVLTTRTPIKLVYDEMLEHLKSGNVFTLTYTYDDPHETSVYTISLANCQLIGIEPSGGGNDSGSETTFRILPEGGSADNMPTVTVASRTSS